MNIQTKGTLNKTYYSLKYILQFTCTLLQAFVSLLHV
jgi:hypothetical protein